MLSRGGNMSIFAFDKEATSGDPSADDSDLIRVVGVEVEKWGQSQD